MKNFMLIPLLLLMEISGAQEVPVTTQQQLEDLATSEIDLQDDHYLQQLNYFKKHPLDVNTASFDDLQSIYFLTDLQIENLLRYRSILGKFLHMYELQSVPSWDLATIEKALPFFTMSPVLSVKEKFFSRFKGDQHLLLRISRVMEKSKGYDTSLNGHFLGDRNHVYFRYSYQYKNLLYFGLTADKDPGEQFFKGVQSKGFDFYGVHFFARDLGSIKSLAVGDYALNLGQGLIQWQSMGFGKSSDVMSIKRQSPVLMPCRSGGEFNFNRGIAITVQKKKIEGTVFTSYKKISGNIARDSIASFSSISTSGYHRTLSEVEDRNRIRHSSFGGNLSYRHITLKVGVNAVLHLFDIPLQKSDESYNRYALNGKQIFNWGIDYSYTFRNLHVFGEMASDKNLNKAFLTGVLLSVDPRIDLSVLYRNIQEEYASLSGNAFTESATPSNEAGIYFGITIKPGPKWQVNAYADNFRFPWIKHGVNAPSAGYEYLVYVNYQPRKKTNYYLRYRVKGKPVNDHSVIIHGLQDEIKKSLRVHFNHQWLRLLAIKARLELVRWNQPFQQSEEGFLGYLEASWKATQQLDADMRLQFFHTSGYNTRLYAYESDVLYGFSIPALYDRGFRYYTNLRYHLSNRVSVWLRWSQTVYTNKTTIGSGSNLIRGNKRSEIKTQIMVEF